jgi:hypothetical protein
MEMAMIIWAVSESMRAVVGEWYLIILVFNWGRPDSMSIE